MPVIPIVVSEEIAQEVKDRLNRLVQDNPDIDRATVLGRRFLECVTAFALDRASDDKTLFEIEHLIADGADLNIPDEHGFRAVHFAGGYGSAWLARRLINSKRCDLLLRTLKGDYASDLAYEWGRDRGVATLLDVVQCRQAFARGVSPYEIRPPQAESVRKPNVTSELGGASRFGPNPSV